MKRAKQLAQYGGNWRRRGDLHVYRWDPDGRGVSEQTLALVIDRAYRYTPVLGDDDEGPCFETLREAKAWAIDNVAYPRALRDGYGYLFGD